MTLKVRLAVIVGGAAAVTVVAVATSSWLLADRSLEDTNDESLLAQAELLARVADEQFAAGSPSGDELSGRAPTLFDETTDLRLQVVGPGEIVVLDGGLPVLDKDLAVAVGDTDGPQLHDATVDGVRFRVATVRVSIGALQLGRDMSSIDEGIDTLAGRLLIVGLVGVAAAALVAWLAARRIVKPVEAVTEAAESLADLDDLPARIEVERGDEIGRLARSFNRVLDALDRAREQQRRLVGDASHELRTPLTSLRMKIELLHHDPALPPDRRQRLLADAVAELGSLSSLVEELVDLASDGARPDEDPVPTDLGELVDEAVVAVRRRTGRDYVVESDGSTRAVRVDGVRRAVGNLLSNAAKFSPDDTPVEVTVRAGAIVVRDHGAGIPVEERDRVFDRFYRSTSERTSPGHGIGLAIVRAVAEAHGGSVEIADAPGGGASVTLRLP